MTTVAQASGALFYRLCLKRFTLRHLFLVIVVASSLLQLSQLILISRLNVQLGLPDVAFAIGDDAILEVSRELLAMPMMVMMAALCPNRAASTVFALLTSVQMAGATLAGSLSAGLTAALGITLDDYSRLWQLTVACSSIRLCTVFCVGLVPLRNPSALEVESLESEALQASSQASGAGAAVDTARTELQDMPMLRAHGASSDNVSENRSENMSENVSGKERATPQPISAGVPQSTLQAQDPQQLGSGGPVVSSVGSVGSSRRQPSSGLTPWGYGARLPWGTILLFSLMVASLLWSLYKIFSSL